MNDETLSTRPDITVRVDVSHGGDVAVERCEEAIAALIALDKATLAAKSPNSAGNAIRPDVDDPDRPAA